MKEKILLFFLKILKKWEKEYNSKIKEEAESIYKQELSERNNVFEAEQKKQSKILKRLLNGSAAEDDYSKANNITRVKYANIIWDDFDNEEKCHYMFHTKKEFNGFSDGEKNDKCWLCTKGISEKRYHRLKQKGL